MWILNKKCKYGVRRAVVGVGGSKKGNAGSGVGGLFKLPEVQNVSDGIRM